MKLTNQLYYVLAATIAVVATLLLFASLNHGVGISPDSVAYIKAASDFRNGGGIESLPNHWPPFYPIVLSAVGLLGDDDLAAIRLFHSALYGLNIVLIPYLGIPKSNKQNVIRLTFSLFLLASPQFFAVHIMAWSEPLFLTLCFSALVLLFRDQSHKVIYISAALIGMATLTRYVGVYFIAMGTVGVLYTSNAKVVKRIKTAFIYGLIAITPSLLFGIANIASKGSSTNRTFNVHIATSEHFESLKQLILGWFTPQNNETIGMLLFSSMVLLIVISYLIFCKKKSTKLNKSSQLSIYLLLTALGYIVFIFTSISFLDAYTPISERVFIPCYVFLWASIFCLASNDTKCPAIPILLLIIAIITSNFQNTSELISRSIRNGIGFLARGNSELAILDHVEKHSGNIKIYSNAPDFLYITRAIDATALPKKYSPSSLIEYKEYPKELALIKNQLYSGDAIVVYFAAFTWRKYYLEPKNIFNIFELQPSYLGPDGVIFSNSKNN